MSYSVSNPDRSFACNCIGPQNGEPVCPCLMRGVTIVDGRYKQIRDLGPVKPSSGTRPFLTGCFNAGSSAVAFPTASDGAATLNPSHDAPNRVSKSDCPHGENF